MRISIRMKLLFMSILLILLTAAGIAATYYVRTKHDKHRESRQRIQIAFDIIIDDFEELVRTYKRRVSNFLQEDLTLSWVTHSYNQDPTQINSPSYIVAYVVDAANELKKFGDIVLVNRLALYAADNRLLVAYQRHDEQETLGLYGKTAAGHDTYLSLDDPSQLHPIWTGDTPIPETPLPAELTAVYAGDIPDVISIGVFREGRTFGIRIVTPIYRKEQKTGILVGDVFYTQSVVERYAALSKTAINFFADGQFSVGILPAQTELAPATLDQMAACEEILDAKLPIEIASVVVDQQGYYQGQCAFREDQGAIGAITVSLSQEFEKQEIRQSLTTMFAISGVVIGVALGLSVLVSQNTVVALQNIVSVIGSAAEGDLRKTAVSTTQDEIGMLAKKLNRMITQLRTISRQVKTASYAVNENAGTIFQQMETLIQHMEQQSTSVDNTTVSVEKIKHFIDMVAKNTTELLSAADLILSSIQETRASIHEVTTSTGALTTNLHLISSSVDQVNQSVKQISENAEHLEGVARQTEAETQRINQSFRDVSSNADQTQQLAKKTMNAVTSGQTSVEASMQGMLELKEVVANTARIIREVNSWGEQVSSILDIVDEITEQTALLSLNASIISAQAGVHGRGFAVVADEIKELAVRTKTSTKEIATLVHALQKKTEEGVKHTDEGIVKAEQGVQLANAVREALNTILDQATHSSNRAADTAQIIQQTADSSQIITASMNRVTEMVSQIRSALQEEEQDIEQVVSAVENISGMAEQVNRASLEQRHVAEQIEHSMEEATEKFRAISEHTETLQQDSDQIVTAMYTIESTTEKLLQNAADISSDTVKNLVQQSDVLQTIVNVFKIS